LFREANNILKGFHEAHAAMGKGLRADLDKVNPALRQAEASRKRTEAEATTQRRSDSAALRSNVRALLKDFDKARAAMSRELRGDLDKADAERRSDVGAMLKGFGRAHATMGRELRADLAKVGPALKGAEADRRRMEAQNIAQRGSDVAAIHFEVWGGAAPPKARAAPPPPRTEAPPAAPPLAEEAPSTATIRDQVFQYLADHPDGARMTELEAEFGMARIHMATLLRSLQDDNKVEKRDLFYFAI
jgi:hypothetical protein